MHHGQLMYARMMESCIPGGRKIRWKNPFRKSAPSPKQSPFRQYSVPVSVCRTACAKAVTPACRLQRDNTRLHVDADASDWSRVSLSCVCVRVFVFATLSNGLCSPLLEFSSPNRSQLSSCCCCCCCCVCEIITPRNGDFTLFVSLKCSCPSKRLLRRRKMDVNDCTQAHCIMHRDGGVHRCIASPYKLPDLYHYYD